MIPFRDFVPWLFRVPWLLLMLRLSVRQRALRMYVKILVHTCALAILVNIVFISAITVSSASRSSGEEHVYAVRGGIQVRICMKLVLCLADQM